MCAPKIDCQSQIYSNLIQRGVYFIRPLWRLCRPWCHQMYHQMVTNESKDRSEVHFCGIGRYDVMSTAVPTNDTAIRNLLDNRKVSLQHLSVPRYLWVPQYRLSSELFITVRVGYQREKRGCQITGSRFPPYLSPKWDSGTRVLALNVQYQTIYFPKYRIKT